MIVAGILFLANLAGRDHPLLAIPVSLDRPVRRWRRSASRQHAVTVRAGAGDRIVVDDAIVVVGTPSGI